MTTPVPHALLVTHGVWSFYSVPVPRSAMSRRSLGMSTVPRLVNALVTAPLAVVPIEVAMAERTAFNPSDLGTCESTIELLQRCHATLQNPGVGCDALQADLRTRAVSRSIRSISVRSLGSINSIRSIHACCFVLAASIDSIRSIRSLRLDRVDRFI